MQTDKISHALRDDRSESDALQIVREATRLRKIVAGLPATMFEAEQAVDEVFDKLDPDQDIGAQLDGYTAEMTPEEELSFLTLMRKRSLGRGSR